MSIPEEFEIDNRGEIVRHPLIKRYFLGLLVVLVALLSFGIGRLSVESRPAGVSINYEPSLVDGTSSLPLDASQSQTRTQTSSAVEALPRSLLGKTGDNKVFASSKGKRYYYEGCANSISDKNKIYFNTPAEAEAAGFTLAANCTPR